ncbi:MAG: 4-hydroxybenzoate octaprenyltransferase, partial [Rhodospirillaceae bacterium]
MANNPDDLKPRFTDIQGRTWFDRILPERTLPYTRLMRLDRPIGAYLLYIPGLWGALLAAHAMEGVGGVEAEAGVNLLFRVLWIAALLLVGAFIMRGAGCVINDMWDRDLDSQVERTAGRPLASGAISMVQAAVFLALLLGLGLLILLQMRPWGILLGVISLVPVALYPLAKRVTDYPQAVLGLTFNFGALIGWAAISNEISLAMLLLYAGCWAWTFGYDTIYAHQDKADDVIIGVRSTALTFGKNGKLAIRLSYAVALVFWFFALALAADGLPFWISLIGLVLIGFRMMMQVQRTDLDSPSDSLRAFKAEQWTGWIWG